MVLDVAFDTVKSRQDIRPAKFERKSFTCKLSAVDTYRRASLTHAHTFIVVEEVEQDGEQIQNVCVKQTYCLPNICIALNKCCVRCEAWKNTSNLTKDLDDSLEQ